MAARAAIEPRTLPATMPAAPAPAVAASPGAAGGMVRLRYLARAPILVHGARSGQSYRFSASEPVGLVRNADAVPMIASGHFRREG